MASSSASKLAVDDVLTLLDVRPARSSRLEAGGKWSLGFASHARLKAVAVLAGECWISLPDRAALRLTAGDTYLLTRTAYVVSSSPAITPRDGGALYKNDTTVRLGAASTVMLGGSLGFDGPGAELLLAALPPLLPTSRSVSTTLQLLEAESDLSARLAEILLVQALRSCGDRLGAFADARLCRALTRMHADIAHAWSVDELAAVAAMSRSAFAAEFRARLGVPPLEYLRRRRMSLARAALGSGLESIHAVAARLGYASPSAFTNAYKRVFGVTPGTSRPRRLASP